MTFATPTFLFVGLILMLAAVALLLWARKKRASAVAQLGQPALVKRLMANINWRGRRWKTALTLVALALMTIAAARPQWGNEVREIEQEGLQVMIALDVSQSMLAEDIKPSRLDRAKLEIRELTERLDGDEVGIVLFSGASFVQVPLTSDYLTALNYLESADPTIISRPGTVIGDAIRTATNAFDPNLTSQKVLIVMTDGEDAETDPMLAAQEAADAGVMIYTIGFGTAEGEPVPETDASGNIIGYLTDANGEVAISRLDEATLQQVAEVGNGHYYQASAGGSELDALLNEIDGLQREQLESRFETTQIERYQLFLWLALAALIAIELIPDRVRQTAKRTWLRLGRGQVETA